MTHYMVGFNFFLKIYLFDIAQIKQKLASEQIIRILCYFDVFVTVFESDDDIMQNSGNTQNSNK